MVPVFVLDPISPRALSRLAEDVPVVDWRDPRVARWVEEASALITRTSPVRAADIARARHLKVIGKHGVGVDNIDLAAARARGIPVVNTPGANADAVAELTLCLALAAARHVGRGMALVREGQGAGALPMGRELAGARLGIMGFGEVGRRVGDLLKRALGVRLQAFDPGLAPDEIRAHGAEVPASFESLLAGSDVLSLHLPLTPKTRGLIGARELALLADGAILINTARGGIVDEMALAQGLRAGKPAAAASDVFATEPPPLDHPLLHCPNFIATPHIGAATTQSLDRVGVMVVEQVLEVLRGAAPRHPVG
ncbi:MAG TPA: hydroxyacid dehydrogenase [Stellaceae bacterium]|nr:hydroxyacid dehydrogenase [Stellaceae bacterium]